MNEPYLRAHSLIGFYDLVVSYGGDPEQLLEEVGIPVKALVDHDMMISYRSHAMLMELAASRLERPLFALEWALALAPEFHNLGSLTLLEHFTRNFGEWIELGVKSIAYHTDGFNLRRIDKGVPGQATYRYASDSFVLASRQQTEHIFALACLLARRVVDLPHEAPLLVLVRFSHSAPADLSLHEQIFNCPLEFDSEVDEFVFSNDLLDARTSGNFGLIKSVVNRFIRYRIDHLPLYDRTVRTTVALAIPSIIGTGNCRIEFVAEALGLSVKQLQRQLANEGTNFSEVFNEVRQNIAIRLLKETNAPIERIAGLLDYSATPAFSLAFKRWYGVSPLQFRKQVTQLPHSCSEEVWSGATG